MASLHNRAQLYATDNASQPLTALVADIEHALLNPNLTSSDREDIRTACEELATHFHIPPPTRIQLLLWAGKCQPNTLPGGTYLQACRVRIEFARFWMEMWKEHLYYRTGSLEIDAKMKWLEYDISLFKEKLNEITVEVMVQEFLQERFEGHHVGQCEDNQGRSAPTGGSLPNPEFSERMFEHPVFSLEYAIFQDRAMQQRCEGA